MPSERTPARPRIRSAHTGFRLGAFCAIAVVAAGLGRWGLDHARALRALWPAEADTLHLPSSRVLQRLAMGHDEMLADLVAARANVYFGSRFHDGRPPRWLARYLNTAADLDPYFHRLYLAGAAMLMYSRGEVTLPALGEANALLRRGIDVFPEDWELRFQLGFNQLFEMPQATDPGDPRVARWRQQGVDALRTAALLDGGPAWLPGLVARMLTEEGSQDMAIHHLEQAYAVASSEASRKQIKRKLMNLKGEQASRQLETERERFEQKIRERYPYAPEAFSILAGPRQPPHLGWTL